MPKSTPVMLINPQATTEQVRSESDMRLEAVKEMLQGLGAAHKDALMMEDVQAACSAAAFLVDDALRLQEEAVQRAMKGGGHA